MGAGNARATVAACAGAALVLGTVAVACGRGEPRATVARAPEARAAPPPVTAADIPVLAESLFAINGVRIGMPLARVRELLGAPDSAPVVWSEMLQDSLVEHWFYPTLLLAVSDGSVTGAWCDRLPCASGAGVTLGDPADAVGRAYGPPHRAVRAEGEVLSYRSATEDRELWFDVSNGRVVAISMSRMPD